MSQGGASNDWVYSDVWDAFVLAVDGTTAAATTLTVWDGKLSAPVATLELTGSWTEGIGLVHKLDGHVPPTARVASDGSLLASVPIDNLRSVGTKGKPFSSHGRIGSWRILVQTGYGVPEQMPAPLILRSCTTVVSSSLQACRWRWS